MLCFISFGSPQKPVIGPGEMSTNGLTCRAFVFNKQKYYNVFQNVFVKPPLGGMP